MTLIEIVQKYVSEGHKVNYRIRKDGGIIITSIDGMKFTRVGEGNKYIRQVTGISLSKTRMEQTSYNVNKFIKLQKGQKKASAKNDVEDLKKLTKRVQRIWRKNATVGEGKVTIRKVRWLAKEYGVEVAKEYLQRRERYAQGYAYEENVNYWVDVLGKMGKGTRLDKQFQELADKLASKKIQVKESDLQKIHDIQYNGSLPLEEKLRQITALIEAI